MLFIDEHLNKQKVGALAINIFINDMAFGVFCFYTSFHRDIFMKITVS